MNYTLLHIQYGFIFPGQSDLHHCLFSKTSQASAAHFVDQPCQQYFSSGLVPPPSGLLPHSSALKENVTISIRNYYTKSM